MLFYITSDFTRFDYASNPGVVPADDTDLADLI